jgi:putative transposase
MKAVARAIGVSRSNLWDRHHGRHQGRPIQYDKAGDEQLLQSVRKICEHRGSYGYRRTTARLARDRAAMGLTPINHKRVYRVMKANDLLLPRYGKKPTRTHDGKIITLSSNLRWCSDTFFIRCWSGEMIEVAFAMDTCDREIMAWSATTAAVTGETIRDLMAESVEQRFGRAGRVPHPIQWLSDNGPAYTASETRLFAEDLGLVPCTTPSYSPQSNGMSEAFVKTFKRDYVYLSDLPNASTVLEQLQSWFEEYNEWAPHKGLRMKSPRQYRRLNLSA